MLNSGIYEIRHVSSGRVYVGSAINIDRRWSKHKTELKKQVHCNSKLQRAWNKYGADDFVFTVLEYVADKACLIQSEQRWIDDLMAVKNGYNICSVAGSCLGTKRSKESIAKTVAVHIGAKRSDETRRRIKEARAKQPPMSNEGRSRISESLRQRVISDETRKKLSIALTGKKASPEAVAKNRAKQIGKKPSRESIAKGIASRAGFKHSEASRQKMSAWQVGRKMSPESIAKAVSNRVMTDELREKLSAAGRLGKGISKPVGFGDKVRARCTGKRASDETRKKLSDAGKGRIFSAETIAKRVATRAKNKAARAPVGQAFAR